MRIERLTVNLAGDIKMYGQHETKEAAESLHRLEIESAKREALAVKLNIDLSNKEVVIQKLSDIVRQRDKQIADIEASAKAERAAAAGYVVGPLARGTDD